MEPRIRPRRRRPRPGWLPLLLLSTSVAGAAAAAATSSHHAAAFTPHPSRPPPRPPRRRPPSQLSALGSSTTNDDDAPRYAARGVSAYKGEVLAAVAPPPSPPQGQQPQGQPPPLLPSLYPDAFCRLVPDVLTGSPEHALIMHADGAGTKAALAYLYWKETGDLGVWRGIAQDALAMNLDDVFCCGATGPALVTSTIGRNRRLVPGEVIAALVRGLEEACAALCPWGVEVGVAGGETADIGDLVRTVTFDCALTARVRRTAVVDNGRIGAGDLIVGLASFGAPAAYESEGYNSGIGANGLTAARHDVLGGPRDALAGRYPESFDPGLPPHLIYSGRRGLTEAAPPAWGLPAGTTVGQLLLSPTRTYAPILARLLRDEGEGGLRGRIHGLVHCSGGGQTKALRCLPGPMRAGGPGPLRLVKDALFPTPPVFRLIQAEQARQMQEQKGASPSSSASEAAALWREMYQVFNMGHRLEAYVSDAAAARAVIDAAAAFGVEARVVGRVEPGRPGARGHVLEVSGEHGAFVYE